MRMETSLSETPVFLTVILTSSVSSNSYDGCWNSKLNNSVEKRMYSRFIIIRSALILRSFSDRLLTIIIYDSDNNSSLGDVNSSYHCFPNVDSEVLTSFITTIIQNTDRHDLFCYRSRELECLINGSEICASYIYLKRMKVYR